MVGEVQNSQPGQRWASFAQDPTTHDSQPTTHDHQDTPVHPHQPVFRASTPSQIALGALPSAPNSRGLSPHPETRPVIRPSDHGPTMGSSARWAVTSSCACGLRSICGCSPLPESINVAQ